MENENDEQIVDTPVETETEATNQETKNEKTYSQQEVDEMKAKWEGNYQKRLDKAISRKMRDVEEENFKKDQLIDVLKTQTKKANIDELLDMSEEQYGVTIQRTRTNKNDDVVLGKNDAKELLEEDEELAKNELTRLASLKRTVREDETYKELDRMLKERASEKEIKESGLDVEIIEKQDFKDFRNKFSKDTSLKEVYEMYEKVNGTTKKEKPFSAGSLKDTKVKETLEFYTYDEYMALTAEQLKDPKVYEKAMKTMAHFYKK